ncbi:PPE family protein (plasmid) [Mycolicibacterium fluoranthenivorans]|uniref:PPE family protein n=1 Tax=Mycolicibacterium fluoranthenivorans TaxID=258505 RepID=A0A7G8P6K8_9MYCO|nr:PPE family protein [Mycolicibacterium fluoranthenivorans]QNJ89974.1 PPE family protein [Mycolicibacterium fluoranthenivorans]
MPAVAPTPIYHAAPPEVHSTLLNTGATAAGVTAAGTSWTQLAAQYTAGIAELEAILAQVQATYQGPSAEKFVAAHQPLLMWMADVVIKATLAAVAHGEIAAAYTTAVITMPTMIELITNHVVHGVLVGTNFFGVNTIPIGMNEADYVRMWNQAADVQTGYDTTTAMAVDSIPETPPSPITLIPGVGEGGNIADSSAGFATQGFAQTSGAALNAGDMMASKLLAGKAATSPLSVADKVPDGQATETQNAANDAGQQLKPENMGSVLQQFTSIASSAPQAASSAIQGPANMLMQAPQQLASAPQQLSSMLGQFAGGFGSDLASQSAALPAGFAGTGAIGGFNPAGMTSLAGGALGTGPSRPLMPSTWGSAPTSAAESMTNAARGVSPVAAGMPGASAGGAGGGGGGMMGHGANNRRKSGSQQVNTYSDDEDADAEADSDGGTFAMTR